jgi:hypothetical protein
MRAQRRRRPWCRAAALVLVGLVRSGAAQPTSGPLRVHATNPRYFADASGRPVYLTGSHTWDAFQDDGPSDPPAAFDYPAFLDFLVAHGHNFLRLWRAENARGGEGAYVTSYWFAPLPYLRPGPGLALDGKPRFALTQWNQPYFDRLRERVALARSRGIYVSIMLFDGWSVESKVGVGSHDPWPGHPYHPSNNLNGIDGDANDNGQGEETQTLALPAITALQEAYVRKVIDTVGDLDNVLYEISNEAPGNSEAWQTHLITLIKSYEAGRPQQHPVGMTVEWPGGSNAELEASPADWISPNGDPTTPPVGDGRKVILYDTDHLCGICGDRTWVWKSLTRGLNPLYMDRYSAGVTTRGADPSYDPSNPTDVSIRHNLGWARRYAQRLDLAAAVPRGELASTGYALAHPAGGQYLVYLPAGGSVTVDLTGTAEPLAVEWFSPVTGQATPAAAVAGGAPRPFTAPVGGDAVLYLAPTSTTTTPGTTTTTTTLAPACGPVPQMECIASATASLTIKESVPGRERLKLVLKRLVAAVMQEQFGNPVTGSTRYDVCIYDDEPRLAADLAVARAGQSCGRATRTCWRALSDKGYRYADPDAASGGVQRIVARGGRAGRGRVIAKAGNDAPHGETALPVGVAAALQGTQAATVQVHTSDGACFGATLDDVRGAEPESFEASGGVGAAP